MNMLDHYRAEFLSHEAHFPEGAGRRKRYDAFDQFAEIGFPSFRQGTWKYTPVDTITRRLYKSWDGRPQSGKHQDFADLQRSDFAAFYPSDPDSHCLVFLNGCHVRRLSRLGKLPAGVIVGSLADGQGASSEVLREHLDRQVAADPSAGFAALNSAFWTDGALIHLTPGAVIDAPIHLLFLSTLDDERIITHPRVLIVAEENSAVDVVEHFGCATGAHYFTNAVTEISLGINAGVRHCKIQNEAEHAFHVAMLRVHQARDSRFASHSVSVGGKLARNDIDAVIGAQGGECLLDGLYMASGRQHVDYHTRIEHRKSHGASRQKYKGVLAGKSHGVFNGKVHVHPDAQHTDARQRNENLLLSPDAQVDTEPRLDIFADDVQCAHGATVGQIDKNMIFYLRSRGIAPDMAMNLLTYGFVNEILDCAPVESIKPRLGELVLAKLPNIENIDMNGEMREPPPPGELP